MVENDHCTSGTEHTECAVCGYEPDPDRVPPHYVLSLSDEDTDGEYVQSYPFGGSLSVPFACSDECWLDAQDDPDLIADGGTVGDSTQRKCTNMNCHAEAEYAYWMPDLGQFSRVRSPEHDMLDDGDLAPHVCKSCRDHMAGSSHWDEERFFRPEEKLVTDGGTDLTCRKCGEEFQKPVDLSMHYRVVHTGALQLGLADQRDRSVDTDTDRSGGDE